MRHAPGRQQTPDQPASRSHYRTGLLCLLFLNVPATVAHYVDNMVHLPQYGEPHWVTPHLIDSFWFLMTPLAAIGYWLIARARVHSGSIALYLYAAASLLVLLHYFVQPFGYFSVRINAMILGEALLALMLTAYVAAGQIGCTRRHLTAG